MGKSLNSSEFKSFIYGTMLGDSTIHFNGKEFKCRQITKGLIEYKAKIIYNQLPSADIILTEYDEYQDRWNHQKTYQLRVKHEYFRKMYDVFYEKRFKVVRQEVLDGLHSNGFAVWYADDGCSNLIGINNLINGKTKSLTDRRLEICTDGFYKEDVEKIIRFFKINFSMNIKCINRDHRDKTNSNPTGYRIRFPVSDAQDFICTIYDDFLNYPELLYKLDLGYRVNDFNNSNCRAKDEYRELFYKISAHNAFKDRLIKHYDIV